MSRTAALSVVGPPDQPDKYTVVGPAPLPGRVEAVEAELRTDDVVHHVSVLCFEDVSTPDRDELVADLERRRRVDVESIPSIREYWADGDDIVVVVNAVEGEPLDRWIADRPGRDPIGSIAALLGLAAGVDRLRHDHPEIGAHGSLSTGTVVVPPDQIARAITPPLPPELAAYVATDAGSPGRPPSAADDAYALAGIVAQILTGEPAASDEPGLRAQLRRFSGRRDLVERIVDARHPDPGRHPTLLVNWLARLRGATVLPTEMTELGEPEPPVAPWRRRLTSTRGLLAVGVTAIALMAAAFLVGREAAQARAAVGLRCDAAEQAESAREQALEAGFAFTWRDSDGDCYHDSYEIHWLGSDYLVPNPTNSTYPPPSAQMRVLLNYYADTTQIRGLDPAGCDPELAADLATAYVERASMSVSWRDDDGDCLHDAFEANALGTDPADADSDDDGQVDGIDIENGTGGMLVPLDEQVIFLAEVHGRNHQDPGVVPVTDPVDCAPEAFERAARVYLQISESSASWVDPDGDCLHSDFERIVTGTDPEEADTDGDGIDDGIDMDSGDGMIEPIDRQFDVLALGG